MRVITFDIETIGGFARGRTDYDGIEVTVVGIHDSDTGLYTAYIKEEFTALWPILERADLLVGFNSDTFDIPILNKYYPGDLSQTPSLDILSEVYKTLGRRIRLEALAQGTLGRGKSGDGKFAGDWWKEGDYEKVKNYCLDDVRLTREIFDYALANRAVKYKDLKDVKEIKLDVSGWLLPRERSASTHILPL